MSDELKQKAQNLLNQISTCEVCDWCDAVDISEAFLNQHQQLTNQQAEIDRLTAQNLQLRLICDRAVVFLLAGSVPDQTLMDDRQLGDLNEYMNSVDYNDLEESESNEDAAHKMLIKPLLEISKLPAVEINLLSFALAEQNRRKLVNQEIDQLRELQRLKPDYAGSILMSVLAFEFSRRAGDPDVNHGQLINDYAPSVILAREAGTRIQPDDVERGK